MNKTSVVVIATLLTMLAGPLPAQTVNPDKKEVGIFYFVWLGQHPTEQIGNYNITELLANHPEDLYNTKGTPLSPMYKYHFWAEPLYGYYNSADPWIIARHVELFMAAGIDYLILDTTNGFCYPEVVKTLLETLKRYQAQNLEVPKVSFYTNGHSGKVVRTLYDTFYKSGEYDSIWYSPKGKPMIIGVTNANKGTTDQNPPVFVEGSLLDYFDVRESQWPTKPYDNETFPWMSWDYPQKIHNGVVSVSVAQHSTAKILFSDPIHGRGRGYDPILKRNLHDQVRSGHNFQMQWNTALNHPEEVSNVFMTGWNEWVAIKYVFDGEVGFVDTFTEEFSRDIEMMKGGYGDNFYLQMARNIRSFKGSVSPLTSPMWDEHGRWTIYRDPEGDAIERDFPDFSGSGRYVDSSARNDIIEIGVLPGSKEITFNITTAKDITPRESGDSTWMNILVKVSDSSDKAFPYDFIIGRKSLKRNRLSVEKVTGAGTRKTGHAVYNVSGNKLTVTVPLKTLGLSAGDLRFSFKVSDHVCRQFDIMDYYVSGDSAPIGRLSYEWPYPTTY